MRVLSGSVRRLLTQAQGFATADEDLAVSGNAQGGLADGGEPPGQARMQVA